MHPPSTLYQRKLKPWLRAAPSPGLDLSLEPDDVQALLKWCLGFSLFDTNSVCALCSSSLDMDAIKL